jgi:hypothetical protein
MTCVPQNFQFFCIVFNYEFPLQFDFLNAGQSPTYAPIEVHLFEKWQTRTANLSYILRKFEIVVTTLTLSPNVISTNFGLSSTYDLRG